MARSLQLLAFFAACFASICGAAAALNDYPFRVETRRAGPLEQVVARNDGPAPITIHVTLSSENIGTTSDWPVTAIVPAHGAVPLGYIAPVHREQPYRYLFSYTYYVGRIDAEPSAGPMYRYPFPDGETHAITQAHGGKLTSHNNKQNLYAVDFDMPVGTPVVAARAGVVVDVVLTHDAGGRDLSFIEQANMITIVHDDGTIAEYAHLSPGKPLVARGQRVAAGALIGYSGNTGYSTGPHLHFVVSRPDVDRGKVIRLSLPIQFYADDSRVAVTPHTGTLAVADYHRGAANDNIQPVAGRGGIEEAPLAAHPLTAQGSTDRQ